MKFECKKAATESLAMVCLLAAAGCQDYEADWTLEQIEQREFIKSGIFNFATSGDVTINLDYNAPGATNPVWIYTEYPFDDEGDLKAGVNAEFAFFLEDGKFQGTMNLPTSADHLYIVTGGMGLPMILSAEVVNGAVELYYDVNEETRGTMDDVLTTSDYNIQAATDYSKINCSDSQYSTFYNTLYKLYDWNNYVNASINSIWSGYEVLTWNPGMVFNTNSTSTYDVHADDGTSITDWSRTSTNGQTLTGNFQANNTNRPSNYSGSLSGGTLEAWITNEENEVKLQNQEIRHSKLENLPAGIYTVSLTLVIRKQNNKPATPSGITFYLNGETAINSSEVSANTKDYYEVHINRQITIADDSSIEFGFNLKNADFNWMLWDNVSVTKSGTYNYNNIESLAENNVLRIKATITDTNTSAWELKLYDVDNYKNWSEIGYISSNAINNYSNYYIQNYTLESHDYYIEIPLTETLASMLKEAKNNRYFAINGSNLTIGSIDVVKYSNATGIDKPYNNVNDETLKGVLERLQNILWHGKGSKQLAKKELETQFINEKYASNIDSENNITVTSEGGAELYVTFLAEYVQYSADVLGYYYYPEGTIPDSPDGLKKFIIFPNCSSDTYRNISRKYCTNYVSDNSNNTYLYTPLLTGDQVQLMYVDNNGTQSNIFPKGTIVGWFIIYNGFNAWDTTNSRALTSGEGDINIGAINNNNGYTSKVFYSNPSFNGDKQARCIQFTDAVTGDISLCFEDSYQLVVDGSNKQDMTYDDVIFSVKAIEGTITNNNDNVITPDATTTLTYKHEGIYAFEDIWDGNRTDFDMNDVAVKYSREFTVTTSNTVSAITETYTLMNDGATYKDGFAVQLPYDPTSIASLKCTYNDSEHDLISQLNNTDTSAKNNEVRVEYDSDKKLISIVLFDDINKFEDSDMTEKTFEFQITFKENLYPSISYSSVINSVIQDTKDVSLGRTAYNPFVIVYDAGKDENNKRCEIHQTGYSPTSYGIVKNANNTADNPNNNRWYVAKLNQEDTYMPFAIDVPDATFVSPHEGIIITGAYDNFKAWATGNGTTNTDWYTTGKHTDLIGWERQKGSTGYSGN